MATINKNNSYISNLIKFIDGIIQIISIDIDYQYEELYKNALKYGMSKNEFWYGEDYKEYFLYEEAYYERLHETSHIQGYYNYIALSTTMSNMFKNKGDKGIEYPEMNILSSQREKSFNEAKNGFKQSVKNITQENVSKVNRKTLLTYY